MAIETPQFRNLNTIAEGRLEEILAGYVAAGHRAERISRLIYAEYRYEVSRQTVDRWLDELGVDQRPEPTDVDDQPEPNGDTEPEARAS